MAPNDPIESLLARYAEAVLAKDLDACLRDCSPDIVVFDAWDRWEYRGLAAWRRFIAQWFRSLGPHRDRVTVKELSTWVDGHVAGGHAILEFAAYDAAGKRRGSLENRLTLVARERAGAWQVVHMHTSIPVKFATPPSVPRAGLPPA